MLSLLRRILTKEQRRFIKFCVVGASGVPVNLLFTWIGYQVLFVGMDEGARKAAAFLIGITVSIFTNFLLNDIWTWRDRDRRAAALGRLLRFYVVCSVASGIQFGVALSLSLWTPLHYLLAQLLGIALATLVNFFVNNKWTFKAKPAEASEPASAAPAPGALAPVPGRSDPLAGLEVVEPVVSEALGRPPS